MAISSLAAKKKGNLSLASSNAHIQRMPVVQDSETPDHFIVDEQGHMYAGRHLIVDLWGVEGSFLADMDRVTRALKDSIVAAGATMLNLDLHRFEPNGGISGVAVLAESHISIHTWPERGYAAIDAFMCGSSMPSKSLDILRAAFLPERLDSKEFRRGVVD